MNHNIQNDSSISQKDKFLDYVRAQQFWGTRFKHQDKDRIEVFDEDQNVYNDGWVHIPMKEVKTFFPYPFYDYKKVLDELVEEGELEILSRKGQHDYYVYRCLKKRLINIMLLPKPNSRTIDNVTGQMRNFLLEVELKPGSPSTPWFEALQIFRKYRLDIFFRIDRFCGRIHTPITNMKGEYRKNLLLMGEEVTSFDVGQMQPQLLGKILKEKIGENEFSQWLEEEKDVYLMLMDKAKLPDRDAAKELFFSILYSPPGGYLARYFGNSAWVHWVNRFKALEFTANPHNKEKPHSNLAFLMQSLEVRLMRKIWQRLLEEGIPFLTVHDEVIVRKSDGAATERIFNEVLSPEFACYKIKSSY
ncbi:MAG TPA: hypothetical protein P5228_08135 [Bacteroidales bacterium]|nr:hypothetical protein [Bacteroidales bacterium]HRZ49176.1 hypothetical protein [Bacteroidales bacterium]